MRAIGSSLSAVVRDHNRRILGEALITLGVGVASCIIVFGAVYWLTYLVFTMCFRGFGYGGPWVMAGIITGAFFLASLVAAWRQVDPIAAAGVKFRHTPGEMMKDMVGIGLGIPIIRRESLAGGAALLIGGPANLLELWPMWCGRLSVSPTLIAESQKLLAASVSGVDPKSVRDPKAIALLYRLHLIKAVHQADATLRLEPTQKGKELLGGAGDVGATI